MGRDDLIKVIDAFQNKFSVSDSSIGIGAMNDPQFVARLRGGRRCWPETADKVVSYLRAQEAELTKFKTTRADDGTWIAIDKRSGLAHSGRTAKAAEMRLKHALGRIAL